VQLPASPRRRGHFPWLPKGWKLLATKPLLDRTRKLSRHQRRVVALVARGLNNREIATQLGIGAHVARNYVSAIYDKIGVSNRVELALWYEARKHEGRLVL
jgi:DNA-binding NarL/FixJ family response regulator